MAKNTRRIPVKWIRDRAKSAYEKDTKCFVCGSQTDLELHHLLSITLLLERWCAQQGLVLDSDDAVLAIRDQFISAHHDEIYNQVYTLCNPHHVRLHQVFGKAPGLNTGPRQQNWLQLQQAKMQDPDHKPQASYGSFFSEFT